jgi:hypothetical protein
MERETQPGPTLRLCGLRSGIILARMNKIVMLAILVSGNTSPEWALVIVGILTFLVIGWQSWETKKAAVAARDSIKLQELAYAQWVNVVNWRFEPIGFVSATDGAHMHILFDIINPTKFPLTVTKVSVFPAEGRSLVINIDHFLSPDGLYGSGFNVWLKDARVDDKGEIVFTPVGQDSRIVVEYSTILGKLQIQEFGVFSAVKSSTDVAFWPKPPFVPKSSTQEEGDANNQDAG